MADTGTVMDLIGDEVLLTQSHQRGMGPCSSLSTNASSSSALEGKHVGILFSRAYVPSCHRQVLGYCTVLAFDMCDLKLYVPYALCN